MARKRQRFRREQKILEIHTCKSTAYALAQTLLTGVIYYTSNFCPEHSFRIRCLGFFCYYFLKAANLPALAIWTVYLAEPVTQRTGKVNDYTKHKLEGKQNNSNPGTGKRKRRKEKSLNREIFFF